VRAARRGIQVQPVDDRDVYFEEALVDVVLALIDAEVAVEPARVVDRVHLAVDLLAAPFDTGGEGDVTRRKREGAARDGRGRDVLLDRLVTDRLVTVEEDVIERIGRGAIGAEAVDGYAAV